MFVEHRGHAVEPEAIRIVLLQPEPDIGEQEPQHLVLGVVEDAAVPLRVRAGLPAVEVLVLGAVPEVDALEHILGGVGVHEVDDHLDAPPMGLVDQLLELVGLAETTGDTEEVADVVAEGSVVGVLQDGHQLNHIVAALLHQGQDVVLEISEGVDFGLDAAHAHMGLVDLDVLAIPFGFGVLELIISQLDVDPIV